MAKKHTKKSSTRIQQILIPVLSAGLILLLVFVLLNREPRGAQPPASDEIGGDRALILDPDADEVEIVVPEDAQTGPQAESGSVEMSLDDGVLSVVGSGTMPRVTERLSRWEADSVGAVVIAPGITAIGDGALQGCSHMTRLVLPASVTQIGTHVFDDCRSLSEITVGEGSPAFRIERGALLSADGTRLLVYPAQGEEQIFPVPAGVTQIDPAAFADCVKLTKIRLPDGLLSIGEEAFRGCEKMDSVSIPASVTEIGEGAFKGCPLRSIYADGAFTVEDNVLFTADRSVLLAAAQHGRGWDYAVPEGVTRIADAAFYAAPLGALTLPDSLREIGDEAFFGADLKTLTLPEGLKSIGAGALAQTGIAALTIPAGVTEIGEGCFRGCSQLAEIRVAEGNESYRVVDGVLFSADGRLLLSCPWMLPLSDYAVPEGVERIAAYAFVGFSQKGTLTIPASVTGIDENALSHSYGLSAIEVDGENPEYCSVDGVLFNKDRTILLRYPAEKAKGSYTVPASVRIIAPCAFSENYELTELTVPGSVAVIADEAFCECAELERLTLEPGIRIIGDEAFRGCGRLVDLTIPEGVIRLGTQAFAYCGGVETLELPGSLRVIGAETFRRNDCLRELVLPEGLPVISDGMFAWCGALETVTIPSSVTAIGQNAFSDCDRLVTVIYQGGETLWSRMLIGSGNTPLDRAALVFPES